MLVFTDVYLSPKPAVLSELEERKFAKKEWSTSLRKTGNEEKISIGVFDNRVLDAIFRKSLSDDCSSTKKTLLKAFLQVLGTKLDRRGFLLTEADYEEKLRALLKHKKIAEIIDQ